MEIVDLNEKARFADQFMPQILRVTQDYKIPFICMEPGQSIPPHPSGTGIFYIVSGTAVMTVGDKEIDVKAGNMIFVEKEEARGIRAVERLVAFAVHLSA